MCNPLNQPSNAVSLAATETERMEGCARRDALAFLSIFFFLNPPLETKKENTSTKKVPLILPKLQRTPNPGLQVSFWSIPVTFDYSSN